MHYFPLPWFRQKLLNSYFPANFPLELHQVWINWKQVVFDWRLCMLWVWSCPVNTKELFLKKAVPKRQKKSLKTNCEAVSFCYICKLYNWNLLQIILSQVFLKDFAKIACDAPFIWNSKKSNNLLCRSFLIIFSLSNHSSPFFLSNFWSSFILGAFPTGCFS